jgi:adenine-specific DNA methylase
VATLRLLPNNQIIVSAYPKRLIEIDLPIRRISEHARREKSIRHGHISTLHIWWARRPLAACRAVICAALWPDPVDENCPASFRAVAAEHIYRWARQCIQHHGEESHKGFTIVRQHTSAYALGQHPSTLRRALLDFIADFANWDNSTVPEFLETSRALTAAAHYNLSTPEEVHRHGIEWPDAQNWPEAVRGMESVAKEHSRPLVVDPFAGGGSIPLEALRVGADAFASDLNPVAVLLNKIVLEYIPKYGQLLADEVHKWGEWIKREAEKELAEFYPEDADGATPIAYLWARTVLSEAPSTDKFPVQIPLLRTLWLSKRKGFLRALRWVRNKNGEIETEESEIQQDGQKLNVRRPMLEIFSPTSESQVEAGTVRGGSATCPVTGFTTSPARVKEQLKQQRGGGQQSRLCAVYVERSGGREFRIATKNDFKALERAIDAARNVLLNNATAFPTEPINPIRPYKNTRGLSAVTRIGCAEFGDLYNQRQSLSIYVFYETLKKLNQSKCELEPDLLKAVQTALAFAISRGVSQNTSVSRWDASRLTIKGAFSKQALAVVWDFAEANPFSGGSADWDGAVEWVNEFIEANCGIESLGTIVQASAMDIPLPSDSAAALVTDPPYFAAIPYADLSDFFYVWFKRGLTEIYPELFASVLTEKADELIVTNAQKGRDGQTKDDSFFRAGMAVALKSARDVVLQQGVGVVVYAEGTTAGWEAILGAIIDSDWIVTSSWPIDTEMENRTQAQGSASLQSSVHIVCRPRENTDGSVGTNEIGDWRDVLQELPRRIHSWMPRLAEEGVVGADAIFACLGPALEIFSRYSRVEKPNGDAVGLKEYLEHVWAAISKEALSLIFEGASTEGFEPDSRLTAMWLWTLAAAVNKAGADEENSEEEPDSDEEVPSKKSTTNAGFSLEYDAARKIAQGLGAHLEDLDHVIEVKGDTARLLSVAERTPYLFGKEDRAAPTTRKKKPKSTQLDLFKQLTDDEHDETWEEKTVSKVGETALDRVHQSMLLFAANRGEALRRLLVEDGVGQDQRFWRLAQALSALYPRNCDEKRWVDGVLARKKGLGL